MVSTFAARYTQSSNYRGIHRYLRAIHGSECRTLLWPVYLSGKWPLQWRFSFYQVLVGMVNMLTTVLALVIIDKVGRKKLVYYGVSGMIISLVLIAFYFIKGAELQIPSTALLIFFLSYIFCCAISICAVIWVLLSEMYPIKVRGLAMSIAGFSLWIGTFLIGQLTPWMLQNLTPAGTFLIFAGMCVPYILIIWKLVPETTGKSLEEIEKNWNEK